MGGINSDAGGINSDAGGIDSGSKDEQVLFDLEVVHAALPERMAEGEWCPDFELSDHAPVQGCYSFKE